jgi:xanthine dehydrogenase/oxidase
MVKVQYEDLDAILSIDEAIQANSEYEGWGHSISRGDPAKIFENEEITIVQGEVRMGGQEHFYLEPNAHLVIPGECGEMVSFSSTQVCSKWKYLFSRPDADR